MKYQYSAVWSCSSDDDDPTNALSCGIVCIGECCSVYPTRSIQDPHSKITGGRSNDEGRVLNLLDRLDVDARRLDRGTTMVKKRTLCLSVQNEEKSWFRWSNILTKK
jgi:hypothetical protein